MLIISVFTLRMGQQLEQQCLSLGTVCLPHLVRNHLSVACHCRGEGHLSSRLGRDGVHKSRNPRFRGFVNPMVPTANAFPSNVKTPYEYNSPCLANKRAYSLLSLVAPPPSDENLPPPPPHNGSSFSTRDSQYASDADGEVRLNLLEVASRYNDAVEMRVAKGETGEVEQPAPVASELVAKVTDELSEEGEWTEIVAPVEGHAFADAPTDVSTIGVGSSLWRCVRSVVGSDRGRPSLRIDPQFLGEEK